MKQATLALAILAAASASAVQFTKDKGDFTTADGWGANWDAVKGGTSYVDFVNSLTVYGSVDFACRLFRINTNPGKTVVMDLTASNPTIAINQQSGDDSILLLPKNNSTIEFKGGKWNAAGTQSMTSPTPNLRCGVNVNESSSTENRTVRLTSGAKMYGLANVYGAGANGASRDCGNRLVLDGSGTELTTVNFYGVFAYKTAGEYSNHSVEVANGAKLTATAFYTDSKLDAVSSWTASGNRVEVRDGGAIAGASTAVSRFGNVLGGVQMTFSGTGTSGSFGQVRQGFEATASGNRVEILDGAVVETRDYYVGRNGSRNVLVVSNATLKLTDSAANGRYLVLGYDAASTGNRFELRGDRARLSIGSNTDFDFFDTADRARIGGNEVLVADGAVFKPASSMGLFQFSTGDRICVTGAGTKFGTADAGSGNSYFSVGRWSAACSNNTLSVENGATLDTCYVRVACLGNTLFVSNATVSCSAASGCEIGYYLDSRSQAPSSGNRLVLAGTTPSIVAPNGPVKIKNASTLDVRVPGEGYADGFAPITAKAFSLDESSTVSVDLSEYVAAKGGKKTFALVRTDEEGVDIPASVMEATNAALANRAKLVLSADGRTLSLAVRNTVPTGLMINFK